MTDAKKLLTREEIKNVVAYVEGQIEIEDWARGGKLDLTATCLSAARLLPALLDALEAAQSELAKAAAERNDIQSKFTELKWAYNKSLERERVLREALKPFAEAVDDLEDNHRDGADIWERPVGMSITAGDLRCARVALATTTDTKGNRND